MQAGGFLGLGRRGGVAKGLFNVLAGGGASTPYEPDEAVVLGGRNVNGGAEGAGPGLGGAFGRLFNKARTLRRGDGVDGGYAGEGSFAVGSGGSMARPEGPIKAGNSGILRSLIPFQRPKLNHLGTHELLTATAVTNPAFTAQSASQSFGPASPVHRSMRASASGQDPFPRLGRSGEAVRHAASSPMLDFGRQAGK